MGRGVLQSTVNTLTLISEVQGDWIGKTEGKSLEMDGSGILYREKGDEEQKENKPERLEM